MEKYIYDIWLSLILTPDTETYAKLHEHFSDSKSVFNANTNEIASVIDRTSSDFLKITEKNLAKAESVYAFCEKYGVGLLAYDDENFPESLRKIATPPVLLYYRGKLPDFKKIFCVSMVGTRSLSKYGRKNAFNISYDLAKAGATVVSGMALGIDGVAAAGALSAGGITIAVLGSGIDVCYPSQHKMLAREIVKSGCVFTEYAPGVRPERFNFPRRNRIISGLSAATVVIEGHERSGALITARHAIEQGRVVYALPGNVENRNSEVSNLLLKNGARVCTSADDIVRDFEKESKGILNPFALTSEKRQDMYEALEKYSVSATSPEDDIFNTRSKKTQLRSTSVKKKDIPEIVEGASSEKQDIPESHSKEERAPLGFDERTLKIYKKIPGEDGCLIESLVDNENNLRDVMKSLLKLEMGRFVKILPGERVARNIKF